MGVRYGNTYGHGKKVHLGNSSYGDVIFTIDPPHIRDGNSSYGTVVATLGNAGKIHVGGSAYGKVIAKPLIIS